MEKKILIIAAIALVLGFAVGRLDAPNSSSHANSDNRNASNKMQQQISNTQRGGISAENRQRTNIPASDGNEMRQGSVESGDIACDAADSAETAACADSAKRQADALAETLKGAQASLKICHDAALASVPDLNQKLELRIFLKSLNGRGKLSGIENLNLLMLPPEALACFVGEISKINFDLSESRDGDETSVTMRFDFGAAQQ